MMGVLFAGCWCAAVLGAQWAWARSRGRASAFAPAKGSPGAGVRYAFTGAMLPWAKESVRMNPGSYATGMIFHLGVLSAFASLALPGRVLSLLGLAGAAAGLALLAKRVAVPHLRGLSNTDDYLSNLLVTLVATLAGAALFTPSAHRFLPWACTALLLYLPLGKLRHCAFFFLSRYHLGAFFGRRGTFPPAS